MPHQCTKCGKVYPDAASELLVGCTCNSRFFYYIRQEKFDELQNRKNEIFEELEKADKTQIEKDIRELTGLDKKPDEPVILDLESIRVIKPGKFEIDVVSLFSKNRPLIYKLEEGKYIIDLSSTLLPKSKEYIKSTNILNSEIEENNKDNEEIVKIENEEDEKD
ncbi:MAG: Zn-ribbon containing protein [Nanoarchaeota archaeon]